MGHVDSSHVQDGNLPLKLNRTTLFPSVAPISAQTYPVFSFFLDFLLFILYYCVSVLQCVKMNRFTVFRQEKKNKLHSIFAG